MRGVVALVAGLVSAVLIAVPAGAVPSVDIYVTGTVLSRVAGQNAAAVRIAWDFKCLGEDRGTYEWTLKVVRMEPEPEQTTTLGTGTSERGSKTIQLKPGRYLPKADPFLCETERGQGRDKPEVGGPFVVPDYCGWTVSSVRGVVQHQHGTAVKAARPGSSVAPGDAVLTPRGGSAVLAAVARDGTAKLGPATELKIDRKHCPGKSGWKLALGKGGLTAVVPSGAAANASFSSVTPNATVSGGRGSRWLVTFGSGKTKVRALAGRVHVVAKGKKPTVLKAGQSATIKR